MDKSLSSGSVLQPKTFYPLHLFEQPGRISLILLGMVNSFSCITKCAIVRMQYIIRKSRRGTVSLERSTLGNLRIKVLQYGESKASHSIFARYDL